MKYKKIFFLVFTACMFLNGFAQTKKTPATDKKNTKTEKTVLTDKKIEPTDKKAILADKKIIISEKNTPTSVGSLPDTLKLKIKSEPAIDTLTNLSLRFKPFKKTAHASYYHDKFNGKRTASGTKFDNKKYTAAHRKLPFGTKVRVTNEANGKFVIVEVNDRGPFSRGREIDLSKKAFMELVDNKNSGAVDVKIEVEDK